MHRTGAQVTQHQLRWRPASDRAAVLEPDSLHVWRADLDRVGDEGVAALSAGERDRAARLRRELHRIRWVRTRAILRRLLGAYLGRDPGEIELEIGPRGKPAVVERSGIDFNLSHSGDTALFAFARDNPVGVDVELAGRERDTVGIAERVLGRAEAERLSALPESSRAAEFLRAWVRHEAAVKCRGEGLGSPAAVDLALFDLDIGSAGAAAVALGREVAAVELWELSA